MSKKPAGIEIWDGSDLVDDQLSDGPAQQTYTVTLRAVVTELVETTITVQATDKTAAREAAEDAADETEKIEWRWKDTLAGPMDIEVADIVEEPD